MATKSRGHIAWSKDGAFEFYEVRGEVYRAPIGNVFDLDTKARIGRWEGSRAHFDRFRDVFDLASADSE